MTTRSNEPMGAQDAVASESATSAEIADPPQPSPTRWVRLRARATAGITRTVLVLGLISLFTDMASEMIAPLRLLFLVQVLSTPLALAGLIEGIAEGATGILKVASGRLADRPGARRGLVFAGYTLSNLAKPILALAANWSTALALVLLDRAGKATRSSPRDAILADAVAPELRGKAFGFHRGADTLGAAIGPLLAVLILATTAGSMRAVFGWTLLPGLLAIAVALLFLRSPRRRSIRASAAPELPAKAAAPPVAAPQAEENARLRTGQGLGARFWLFATVATCFALGNSSDAFLFLRTEGLEASLTAVPLVYFVFNLVYALLATPLGALSDRVGRLPVLAAGYGAFALVYLGWVHASAGWQVWALFVVYGVYYAATDGVARAFVCDLVPTARRGTALGWFNALIGCAALPANLIGAWLWSMWGPQATFAMGAWLGAAALGLLLAWWPWLDGPSVLPEVMLVRLLRFLGLLRRRLLGRVGRS